MYDFLSIFGMHGTYMCVFGYLIVISMFFSRWDSGFNLGFAIPNSHDVIGFFNWLIFRLPDDFGAG